MTEEAYATPKSDVEIEDKIEVHMREKTPVSIYLAVFLLIVSTIASAFNIYEGLHFGLDAEIEKMIGLGTIVLMFSVWLTLARLILMRKVWAYILVFLLLLVGTAIAVTNGQDYLFNSHLDVLANELNVWLILADILTIIFLVLPSSAKWFFQKREEAA